MTNISNERDDITTDSKDVKGYQKMRVLRWLYANKFDSLDECKKSLESTNMSNSLKKK